MLQTQTGRWWIYQLLAIWCQSKFYLHEEHVKNPEIMVRSVYSDESISCHWYFSITPENIKQTFYFFILSGSIERD